MQHQGYERIAHDDYLGDLTVRPIEEVRAMRAECQAVEADLSYLRRLVQGRLDIVASEARRARVGRGARRPGGAHRLPGRDAQRALPGPGRKALASAMGPSTPDDSLTAELDRLCDGSRLADLGQLDDAELGGLVADLTGLEREVSQRRTATFQRLDALSAEITRRYRTGEATVESLLS